MTPKAREDYPSLAAIEHDLEPGPVTDELRFALDEIDRLRHIRDIVEHA